MKTNIIQVGDSPAVRIPKRLLEQLNFEKSVELEVTPEGLLLRPSLREAKPRADWAEQFAAALRAENGADEAREEFAAWDETPLTAFNENEW